MAYNTEFSHFNGLPISESEYEMIFKPSLKLISEAKISPPKCLDHISPMKEEEMISFWESLDERFGKNENVDKFRKIKDRMFESLYYCVTNERNDQRLC